jgi:predicted aminopeptidase
LSPGERDRLELTTRIKSFGEQELGLAPTRNYEKVNLDFDQVIWNVSGCAPDRFRSHMYRYPVVGALPYIGFFDRAEADAEAERLEALGWEVWVRPAGAYSTLGWFQDPLWRSMLRWSVEGFANTVLHELAHATVWIPGEGKFNESFAAFVGDEAAARFMAILREERPEAYRRWQDGLVDSARYREFMHGLYARLEGLYASGLGRDEVLAQKARVIADGRRRYAEIEWIQDRYRRRMGPDVEINNARLMQFRVYNTGLDVFEEALQRFDDDLGAFLKAARELPRTKKRTKGPWDPYDGVATLKPTAS